MAQEGWVVAVVPADEPDAQRIRPATLRLRPYIGNVQVKEASLGAPPSSDPHDSSLSRGGTYDLLLGQGDIDHMSYLKPLRETAYDGAVHCRSRWRSFRVHHASGVVSGSQDSRCGRRRTTGAIAEHLEYDQGPSRPGTSLALAGGRS